MSKKDIKVPNIGEFKDVEVIEVLIQKGQQIKKNEPLITIESDKSSVEIPSPDSGTITSLDVKVGDKVSEGDKILEIEIAKDVVEKNKIELYGQKKTEEIIEVKTPENKRKTNPQNLIVRDFSSITSTSLNSPIFGTLISFFDIL